jgi:hypothetical protein
MKKFMITRRRILQMTVGGLVALPIIRIGWYKYRYRKIKRQIVFSAPIKYGYATPESLCREDLKNIGGFAKIYRIYASQARLVNLSDKFHVTFEFLGTIKDETVIEAELVALNQNDEIVGYNKVIQKDPRRKHTDQSHQNLMMGMELATVACELDKGVAITDLKKIVFNLVSIRISNT